MYQEEYFREKRKFPRFKVSIPASFSDPFLNKAVPAYTCDISDVGVGLISDKIYAVETEISVCLEMPDTEEIITRKGKVVWSDMINGKQLKMGVEFEEEKLPAMPLALRTIQSQIRSRMNT